MRASLFVLLILLVISGCSSIRPQITSDATDFNVAVANTNNVITLKNIARSYLRHPRHYTAISDIRGNFTVQGSAGVSGLFGIGRGNTNSLVDTATTTATTTATEVTNEVLSTLTGTTGSTSAPETLATNLGLTYTTNPQYTVAILESQNFTNGILNPLSAETLGLLGSQGWNSTLLANLLIESMTFEITEKEEEDEEEKKDEKEKKDRKSASYRIENKVRKSGWKELAASLDIGVVAKEGDETDAVYLKSISAEEIAALVEQGMSVRHCKPEDGDEKNKSLCTPGDDKVVYRKVPGSSKLTIRRNSVIKDSTRKYILDGYTGDDEKLAKRLLKSYYKNPDCQDNTRSKPLSNGSKNSPENCPLEFRLLVNMRSTDGVVYYLGEYMRYILDDKDAKPILLGGSDVEESCECQSAESMELFRIAKDKGPSQLSTSIGGMEFRVPPVEKAGRTMQVIGLVQQLLNLNKTAEDLPKANLFQIQ